MTAEKLVAGPLRGALEQAAIDLDFTAAICENASGNEGINRLAKVIRGYAKRARTALASLPSSPAHEDSAEFFLHQREIDGPTMLTVAQIAGLLKEYAAQAAPPVAEKTELDQAGRPPRTVGCIASADCIHECPVSEPESRLDEFKTTVIALWDPDLTNEQKKEYIVGRRKELLSRAALGSGQELRDLAQQLQNDSDDWDSKNDDSPIPKESTPGFADYLYGYNAGVSEGFRSASAKLTKALALPLAPKVPAE